MGRWGDIVRERGITEYHGIQVLRIRRFSSDEKVHGMKSCDGNFVG